MAYQYYNEMNTEDLINSPQWTDVFSYSQTFDHEPTEEELLELGVYVDGSALMKDFNMSVARSACVVKFRMTVQPIPATGDYKLTTRGVAIDSTFNDFIRDASLGFGYVVDDYTQSDIAEIISDNYDGSDIDIERNVINGIIDIYGQSSYDYNILDLVYNYFEQFPNINNPCVVNQRPLPEGQSFISNYDHSNLINNLVAYDDNNYMSGMYTPTQFKQSLERLYETDANFKSIIDNSQVIRTCVWSVAPEIKRMYVNGYTIDNASIVTTTESGNNQHYAGVITHIKGGQWSTSPYDFGDRYFHNEGLWDGDTGYTTADVFYNYYRTGWFASNGLTHTALVGSGPIIDSIGISSTLNPVTPISNLHTKWYAPDVDNVYKPLGHEPIEPSVPIIDVQVIIRRGVPPVIIKPRPIPNVLPQPHIDPLQPITYDNIVGLELYGANIYHPHPGQVRKFFRWLWDRDTWTEKQNMNSDPLQSIISLHTLPLPDVVPYDDYGHSRHWYDDDDTHDKEIYLGYLKALDLEQQSSDPDPIKSHIVHSRVCHYCLGHVTIERTYLDYRDYDREIYIYLPYVGFKQLRGDDVTPYLNPNRTRWYAEIFLDYYIDIVTGDFQAIISINKNNPNRDVLYTFNGNMAVTMPVCATDKTILEQARWNLLMSFGKTALGFGGAIAATAMGMPQLAFASGAMGVSGAGGILNNLNTIQNQNVVEVERCGAFAGSYGALAPKTPYVVINSPIGYDTAYEPYSGDSANVTMKLGLLTGFVRCKYVHVDTLASATLYEKNEIELALLEGVIF